jgi:5-(carboxyamino)imidazole ribonucleotide synthase
VIGGGQLGRMLGFAGLPIGFRFTFLEPTPSPPASAAGTVLSAAYDDPHAIERLAEASEIVTYEFENVPVEVARSLADRLPVRPAAAALEAAQDRVLEKHLFARLGVPTATWSDAGADGPRFPALVKTRRLGYDGRGQAEVSGPEAVEAARKALGGAPTIVEERVDFLRELSILAVRSIHGETRFYPLVENLHRDGILRVSRAPAPDAPPHLQRRAEEIADAILNELDYSGVLAVELFETAEGLLANEIAPRVHNSGHWTIEGAETSQFENHLRAVAGLPLGATHPRGPAAMVNLIGNLPALERLLDVDGAHVHIYDKEPRPNRKLGHVTLVGENLEERLRRTLQIVEEEA